MESKNINFPFKLQEEKHGWDVSTATSGSITTPTTAQAHFAAAAGIRSVAADYFIEEDSCVEVKIGSAGLSNDTMGLGLLGEPILYDDTTTGPQCSVSADGRTITKVSTTTRDGALSFAWFNETATIDVVFDVTAIAGSLVQVGVFSTDYDDPTTSTASAVKKVSLSSQGGIFGTPAVLPLGGPAWIATDLFRMTVNDGKIDFFQWTGVWTIINLVDIVLEASNYRILVQDNNTVLSSFTIATTDNLMLPNAPLGKYCFWSGIGLESLLTTTVTNTYGGPSTAGWILRMVYWDRRILCFVKLPNSYYWIFWGTTSKQQLHHVGLRYRWAAIDDSAASSSGEFNETVFYRVIGRAPSSQKKRGGAVNLHGSIKLKPSVM